MSNMTYENFHATVAYSCTDCLLF